MVGPRPSRLELFQIASFFILRYKLFTAREFAAPVGTIGILSPLLEVAKRRDLSNAS
jgi:hypothetical protein